VIVVMAIVWAGSWALLAASGVMPGTWTATFFVAACASVFAHGETLLQPTMPAIVNDLAPDHLRGRYNGLTSGCFQAASILGPILAGYLIGHDLHLEYIQLLIAGCALVAWLSVARLEPQLDDRANGLLVPAPATVAPGDITAPSAQPVVEQVES
jgi:MFS family permease